MAMVLHLNCFETKCAKGGVHPRHESFFNTKTSFLLRELCKDVRSSVSSYSSSKALLRSRHTDFGRCGAGANV